MQNMKTLIIDNYDSFTYNLVDYLADLGGNPIVYKNDKLSLREIIELNPTHIVISPGPGRPENERDFGVCKNIILDLLKPNPLLKYHPHLLGVCLGHQGLIYYAGGKIKEAPSIRHGKTNRVKHEGKGIFKGLPSPIQVMRYHSLTGDIRTLPKTLEILATTIDDPSGQPVLMGIRHKVYPLTGVQFHPESIGTEKGKKLLKNFLFSA